MFLALGVLIVLANYRDGDMDSASAFIGIVVTIICMGGILTFGVQRFIAKIKRR